MVVSSIGDFSLMCLIYVGAFVYSAERKMSNYQGDAPAEYIEDVDDEMEDVGDDMDEEFRADDDDDLAASDSDVEEFDYSVCYLSNLLAMLPYRLCFSF